jgi:hypothetical protein
MSIVRQQDIFEYVLHRATETDPKEISFSVSQPVWFSLHTLQREIIKDMIQGKGLKLDIFFEA